MGKVYTTGSVRATGENDDADACLTLVGCNANSRDVGAACCTAGISEACKTDSRDTSEVILLVSRWHISAFGSMHIACYVFTLWKMSGTEMHLDGVRLVVRVPHTLEASFSSGTGRRAAHLL